MVKKPITIAEICCNHNGDIEIAKEMIKTSALFCKADIVKFQKRNPQELLTSEEYVAKHPVPDNSFGSTYGEHRKYLEFAICQHQELKNLCNDFNITYSSSVWDMTSAKEIMSLEPDMIKVPSAANLKFDMLKLLCEEFKGEIHISLGMTTLYEEKKIIDLFKAMGRNKDIVLYACTSGYPVAFEDICLLEITRLKDQYGEIVKGIGFSGHHLGIATDIAAFTLGAGWIERHFTLDRTWKGTDHAASLEPDGFRRLVRDLSNVEKALRFKPNDILPVEAEQRIKLKRFYE
jgi:N-acetylneuraminate synthase